MWNKTAVGAPINANALVGASSDPDGGELEWPGVRSLQESNPALMSAAATQGASAPDTGPQWKTIAARGPGTVQDDLPAPKDGIYKVRAIARAPATSWGDHFLTD